MPTKLIIELVIYFASLLVCIQFVLQGFNLTKYKVKENTRTFLKYIGLIGSAIIIIQLTVLFYNILK